jgi:hypothetical protein
MTRPVRSSGRYRLLDVHSTRSVALPHTSNACSRSCALSDFNRLHASRHISPECRATSPLSSASLHAPCIPSTSSSMVRRPAIDRQISRRCHYRYSVRALHRPAQGVILKKGVSRFEMVMLAGFVLVVLMWRLVVRWTGGVGRL